LAIHDPSPEVLCPRERQVVALLARGLRLRNVAGILGLSPKTVDAARQSAYDKLGIHDRVILALWANRHEIGFCTPVDLDVSCRKSAGDD